MNFLFNFYGEDAEMSRRIIALMEPIESIMDMDQVAIGDTLLYPKRAVNVLELIYESAIYKRGFFAHIQTERNAPQRIFFPSNTREGDANHILWLLFAAMTDRRGQSMRIYEGHQNLWEEHRWLYSEEVIKSDPDTIIDIVRGAKLGLHRNIIENWTRVAKTLFESLDGNPLNIYRQGSINTLVYPNKGDAVLDLPGFGPKILSLLSMFYAELDVMKMPEDAFPVDVHVQRIAISTGILGSRTGFIYNSHAEAILRLIICHIIHMKGWSQVELSNALWLIGNKGCSGCYRSASMSHFCPVYTQCAGAIDSGPYYKGKWDLTKMYLKSRDPSGVFFSDDAPLMQFANND